MSILKVIVSGGGTGGHIFPALSIADEIKREVEDCEILFVGAKGRMEMKKVPEAGYNIEGLPIAGIQRRLCWENILFLPKLILSLYRAYRIIKDFKPDIVIGTGGYASAPIVKIASFCGVDTYIQEQNSFAGVTNKWLSNSVKMVFVAYKGMERFFPKSTIVLTGNPIRKVVTDPLPNRDVALDYFGIDSSEDSEGTILVVGGSLGARTLNVSLENSIDLIESSNCRVIWQTGSLYYNSIIERLEGRELKNIEIVEFIKDMGMAFSAADLVISRAGAGTLSELAVVGKPSILVPSPNVSEDHQTHNAMALVNEGAALFVRDVDAVDSLVPKALTTVKDRAELERLSTAILSLAKGDAVESIVENILRLSRKYESDK